MPQTAPTQQQLISVLPDGRSAPPPDATAEQTRILLQQTAPDPPQAVRDYLGLLGLLYGVPFENLVADPRMLPRESLRFFYVDANWIASLVDGALSTGVHSDRDIRFCRVLRDTVRQVTEEAIGEVRPRLRGQTAGTTLGSTLTGSVNGPFNIAPGANHIFSIRIDNGPLVSVTLTPGGARTAVQIAAELNLNAGFTSVATASADGGPISIVAKTAGAALRLGPGSANPELGFTVVRAGFLMRSAVVSGWPGLEVKGYRDTSESDAQKIGLLRMDRLAPDVLLVIFESVPALVVINEPRETLHFGTGSVTLQTRDPLHFADGGTKPGIRIPPRPGDATVIDVKSLRDNLKTALSQTTMTSADLAIQMVDSAIKYRFKAQP